MVANDTGFGLGGRSERIPREPAALFGAVILFVVQDVAVSYIGPQSSLAWLRAVFFTGATVGFVALALVLRRYLAAWVVAAGIVLNFIPMAAHGGLMPIAYEVLAESGAFPVVTESSIGSQVENSKDIVLWREDVRFYALSDRFLVTVPGYGPNIYSLGDFVAFAGVGLGAIELLYFVLTGRRPFDRLVTSMRRGDIAPSG